MGQIEIVGWTRTVLLAIGGFAGVMITAGLIHVAKGGRGRRVAGLKLVKKGFPQVR